jgi:hypothetical protein
MRKPKPIKTIYKGIDIIYNESFDRWTFTVNNRDRSATTLTLAKESINISFKAKKSNIFTPVKAYYKVSYLDDYEEVVVTSIAETQQEYDHLFVWIKKEKKGKVSKAKVSIDDLYIISPKNQDRIAVLKQLHKKRDSIIDQIDRLESAMVKLKIKEGE